MTTVDFITELYCKVDDGMAKAEKHVQANLRPSAVVTIAILFALKFVVLSAWRYSRRHVYPPNLAHHFLDIHGTTSSNLIGDNPSFLQFLKLGIFHCMAVLIDTAFLLLYPCSVTFLLCDHYPFSITK